MPTKKSGSIGEQLERKRWDEARKQLKRLTSPERIGEILYAFADDPEVPDDIFEDLLSKLDGKTVTSEYSHMWGIERRFWINVCNVHVPVTNRGFVYDPLFKHVCRARSETSLFYFMEAFSKHDLILTEKEARETIYYMWLCYLTEQSNFVYPTTYKCTEECESELLNISTMDDLRSNENLCDLWQKTELMVRCTWNDGLDYDSDDLLFVHTLIQYKMPRVIIWLAIRLYPDDARVRDEHGRLPLHWAAVMNDIDTEDQEYNFRVKFSDKMSDVREKRLVEMLVDVFPEGAGYTDKEGAYPLNLLLNLEYQSWTLNDWTKRCVLALIVPAPQALSRRSKLDCMLPFMTAACIHDENTVKAESKRGEQAMLQRKFDLTYTILRADPSLVSSGRIATAHESYYKKKFEESQDTIKKLEEELAALKKSDEDQSTSSNTRSSKRKKK